MRLTAILFATIGIVGLSVVQAQQQAPGQQAPSQPGTTWSETQLREAIAVARVGKKLTPKSWPNGSRVAV